MRYQRFIVALVAFMFGILCWQRSWLAAAVALIVCLELILDDHALELLDEEPPTTETPQRGELAVADASCLPASGVVMVDGETIPYSGKIGIEIAGVASSTRIHGLALEKDA